MSLLTDPLGNRFSRILWDIASHESMGTLLPLRSRSAFPSFWASYLPFFLASFWARMCLFGYMVSSSAITSINIKVPTSTGCTVYGVFLRRTSHTICSTLLPIQFLGAPILVQTMHNISYGAHRRDEPEHVSAGCKALTLAL